jgi:hypothetical protein
LIKKVASLLKEAVKWDEKGVFRDESVEIRTLGFLISGWGIMIRLNWI